MNGRLENVIEGLIAGLIMCALFFVVAILAKLIFKKSIGTGKYYSVAIVSGFVIAGAIIPAILKSGKVQDDAAASTATGLDARFIAPPPDRMEGFIGQLKTATDQLSPTDQATLNDALAFLTFIAADDVKQHDPAKFAKWGPNDLLAHSMVKMYNYARDQGAQMTLRKYILLAADIKKVKPELFQQYSATAK